MCRSPLPLVLLVVAAAGCGRRAPADERPQAPPVVVPRFTVAPPAPPPPPPATPGLAPAAHPVCVLTENEIHLARTIPLHVEESAPFMHVDEATTLEVRLASPRSTVRASRSDLEVIGHVKLSDVPVRLRSGALVDGYLRVIHATLRDGDPAHLALEVAMPWFLKPVKAPAVSVACEDIALARDTGRSDLRRGKPVDLRQGAAIELRATPGGPVVATASFPEPEPGHVEPDVETHELERRGEHVLVRIEGDGTDVEGWVSRRDVLPHAELAMLGVLGMLGSLSGGGSVALASELPLFVRTGGRVVRVGTAGPGMLACVKPESPDPREIEIELDLVGPFGGLGFGGPGKEPSAAEAKPFVAPAHGETCVTPHGR